MLVEFYYRVLYLLRAFVEYGARIIEESLALVFPCTNGSTATSTIDETLRILELCLLINSEVAVEEVLHVFHVAQEVCLHEYVTLTLKVSCYGGVLLVVVNGVHTIYIEKQMALLVHLDGKRLLAVVLRTGGLLRCCVEGKNWRQAEIPFPTSKLKRSIVECIVYTSSSCVCTTIVCRSTDAASAY